MDRKLDFQKIVNARDLGGLVNREGRTVRRGLLLRTANLSQATREDLRRLAGDYRLSLVIDLRTQTEREERPDRLPAGVRYLPDPLFDEATGGITREEGQSVVFSLPDMPALYRTMVTAQPCKDVLSRALREILSHAYETGAVLWHCTAGKDRCGVVSALVLAALGVDRAEIMRDYAIDDPRFLIDAEELYRSILRSGRSEAEAETARECFLASPRFMEAALDAIEQRHGGPEVFLTEGLGIPESLLSEFREKLLL